MFLVVAVFSPSALSDEKGGPEPEEAKAQETAKEGGWFRKLFKRQATTEVVEKSAPEATKQPAAKEESKRRGSDTDAEEAPKRGIRAIGKKLAGFLVLEEEPGIESKEGSTTSPGKPRPLPDAKRIDMFVVTEDGTPLYEDGPLQNRPVDLKLDAGAIVSMVKWRKGWCDVRLGSGEFGTVATDLLRKAKASDFPVEELAVSPTDLGEDGSYADVTLPEILPLLAPVELPDFLDSPEPDEAGGDSGLNPLLLPPLPE